jgi:hypothetical protein
MRSELVFRANDKVANRFELCRLASSSARTMVRNSIGMHLTINQALEAIGAQSVPIIAAGVLHVDTVDAVASVLEPAI